MGHAPRRGTVRRQRRRAAVLTDHDVGEQESRRIVYERSGGRCELCGRRATDYAHRKARSQGGRWSPTNALHLCRDCHAYSHAHPTESYDRGWMVRGAGDPAEAACQIGTWLGPGWYRLEDWGGYAVVDLTPHHRL